jgi:hypothetical protein
MAKKWTYDSKCYELAGWFCSDVPELANDAARHWLAHAIQTCIETELEHMRDYGIPTEDPK